jgi:hypothetical protein
MLILVKSAFLAKDAEEKLYQYPEKDILLSNKYVYCVSRVQA